MLDCYISIRMTAAKVKSMRQVTENGFVRLSKNVPLEMLHEDSIFFLYNLTFYVED